MSRSYSQADAANFGCSAATFLGGSVEHSPKCRGRIVSASEWRQSALAVPACKLVRHCVEKPWGRHRLFPGFPDCSPDDEPIGEVWFQTPGDNAPELLTKYLFTGEKLSVQVHPDDEQARARGFVRGKDECWMVLAADPDSTIALGPKKTVSRDLLRDAALDGSIENLLDWKPARAGDFFYLKAGTIHAIGSGITLIEVQQNSEATFRLYDYGRPRELHLEDGVAIADVHPYQSINAPNKGSSDWTVLVNGPKFVLEHWSVGRTFALSDGITAWLIPVLGSGEVAGVSFEAGDCIAITGTEVVEMQGGAKLLFAHQSQENVRRQSR